MTSHRTPTEASAATDPSVDPDGPAGPSTVAPMTQPATGSGPSPAAPVSTDAPDSTDAPISTADPRSAAAAGSAAATVAARAAAVLPEPAAKTVEQAGRVAEQAGQKVQEATQQAGQKVEEAKQQAGQKVERAQRVARAETHPPHVALARGRAGMVVAILGVVGFVGIFAVVRAKQSQAFDLALTMKVQAARNPLLAGVMRLVSWPGFPPQSRVIPPTVMAGLWLLRFRLEAVFQFLAWGTGGLSTVVKAIMKRPRPVAGTDLRVVAAPLGGSSFPSGHVITYAGTYGWMAYMAHTLIRPRHLRRSLVTSFAGLVALVGPSRIYQGHHWPTDVIASYMLGLSYFIGLSSLYRRFKRQRALE